MTSRTAILQALKGRNLTIRGLAKVLDVENLTTLAAMCQDMTERRLLDRDKNGRDPGGRGAVYLYRLASSAPASAAASGPDLDGPGPAREEAPPSATPARARDPIKSAAPPSSRKGRGRRTTTKEAPEDGISVDPSAVAEWGDLKITPGAIQRMPAAPVGTSTLEVAIWSSGAIDLVRGTDTMRLERDDVDQLKVLLDTVYAAVKAVPA